MFCSHNCLVIWRLVFRVTLTVAILTGFHELIGQTSYTYHQLEEKVMSNCPQVTGANFQVTSAQAQVAVERLDYWPKFSSSFRYLEHSADLTVGLLNADNSLIFRLSQDLVAVTKVRSGRVGEAKAKLEEEKIRLRQAESNAMLDFRLDYIDLLEAEKLADKNDLLQSNLSQIYKITKRQFELGEALEDDLIESRSELELSQNQVKAHKEKAEWMRAALANYFNIADNQILGDEPPDIHISQESLIQNSDSTNLRGAIYAARSSRERSVIKSANYRDIHFEPYLGYRFRWGKNNVGKGSAEAGVSLSFPMLFPAVNRQRTASRLAASNALQEAASSERRRIRFEISDATHQLRILALEKELVASKIRSSLIKKRNLEARFKHFPQLTDRERLTLLEAGALVVKREIEKVKLRHAEWRKQYQLLDLAGLSQPEAPERTEGISNANEFQEYFGVWLWQTDKMIMSEVRQQELLDFCEKTKLTAIYFSLNESMTKPELSEKLRTVIAAFHRRSIRVSALIGDPNWVLPHKRAKLRNRLNYLSQYNREAAPESRFDAVHLDIEPHAAPGWREQSAEMVGRLAETVAEVRQILTRENHIKIEIDLPLVYLEISKESLQEIIDNVDMVTLMVYGRGSAEEIWADAQSNLSFINKPTVVAIRAKDFESQAYLYRESLKLSELSKSSQNCIGIAVHDYNQFNSLRLK